ncbi:hypothetical protein Ea357_306 [Erwinia phage Ea35-70]|uniref:Uncharacterized protein n=6 Tax=Agricanvirus TaxID=1984776 RepID=A0A191ZCK3_9CAUD|nr:hypothetical protein Ea357_306 [Erwinia phage Ea35-70]YP_009606098.1 hypothetical protein FDH99_gp211 [Erwinia phage vB_EamM_Simmy50]YP_009606419.1 hypothetical protein FDI00_gp313 [Erwinia phage vB_EamM_Special G]YP_009622053.1 hypothetical protein FDJ23_gp312 [Erwinia phage vB_EamM_Desertfox]AUG87065.1 hypothetical protein MORTIMER_317 [Erwinia phage vB_EamM_Mortimer]QBP07417.1 hypothetical protein REBECCA_312 [Erwinia phage Rebecca]AHI60460.1 hypothetical protein Ea357_306 [Erwinia phag
MKKNILLAVVLLSAFPSVKASMDVPPDPYTIQCLSETECFYANGRKVTEQELQKLALLIQQEEQNESSQNNDG